MLTNFVRASYKTAEEHRLVFYYRPYDGFAFPCDAEGNVLPLEYEAARNNLAWCREHANEFEISGKVWTERRRVKEPAHGTCTCGREVYLYDQYMGACECDCGRWYNLFGQQLNPPAMWEE